MRTSLDALNAETLSLHLISAFTIVKLIACWEILNAFCRLLIFFKINFFEKFFQEHLYVTRVSNFWIQIRPNILAGLIWVQAVCKGYQQTTC